MARCWSCEKVRGKRVCPARGGALICSRCCGTKRQVEIQCPADCAFLHGADPSFRPDSQKREEARFLSRFLSLNERQVVFMLFLHHLLLSQRARFDGLADLELAEVVGAAAKTLETQEKGIVYRHPTSSPHLDQRADWLVGILSRRSDIPQAPEASDEDVRRVAQALQKAIRDHASEDSSSYLQTAAEVLRRSLDSAPPVELPGDSTEPPADLIVPP